MSASTSAAGTVGSIFVVTHVIPATEPQNSPQKTKFSRGRPEALGTVQIMVGLLVLLFGIIVLPRSNLEIYSGVFLWGPLSFSINCCLLSPHYSYHYFFIYYVYKLLTKVTNLFSVFIQVCLPVFILGVFVSSFSCLALALFCSPAPVTPLLCTAHEGPSSDGSPPPILFHFEVKSDSNIKFYVRTV
ncbi:hypothetical protein ACER0C_016161 [Sarotherodon galilaeus]